MADDIDALLDEVEASLDMKDQSIPSRSTTKPTSAYTTSSQPVTNNTVKLMNSASNTTSSRGEFHDILHDEVPLKKPVPLKIRRSSIAQDIQKDAK